MISSSSSRRKILPLVFMVYTFAFMGFRQRDDKGHPVFRVIEDIDGNVELFEKAFAYSQP